MDRGSGGGSSGGSTMEKDIAKIFGTKRHQLKLGKSFSKNKEKKTAFHSIRYDFKPASIDHSKEAELVVGEKGEVNITLPNDQTKGVSCTKFKGSKNPYKKDCVLIYDHITGEFTLERLSCNIQVKRQRQEAGSRPSLTNRPRPTTLDPNSAISSKTSPNRTSSKKEGLHPSLPDLEQSREDDVSPLQPSREPTPSPIEQADGNESSSSSSYMTDSSDGGNNSSSDEEEEKEEEESKPNPSQQWPSANKMSTESTSQAPIHSSPKTKPHLEKLKTHQKPPSSSVLSQLSADLQLSESDSDSD